MVAFDKILTSAPLNATAGRVMSRGTHWEPEGPMPPGLKHWKAPPPLRKFVKTESNVDLTGKKWGRFTAIGMSSEGANDGARWIVRCVCGDFEARSAKTIKAALAGLSADNTLSFQCYYCFSWKAVQARLKRKGSKPLSEFVNARPRTISGELRTPETIVADAVREKLIDADLANDLAVKVIGKLNSNGYRVTRDPSAPSLPSNEGKTS